jgi:hypothetical protein
MGSQSPFKQIAASESFAFRQITKKVGDKASGLNPLEIMESCEMVHVVETASFDFPNYPEAKKSFHAIYFKLSPDFVIQRGLFNGLISIGKPEGVLLEFQKELGTYTLKYYQADETMATHYISKIFRLVSEEIRFKRILKRSIEKQKAFVKEEQLLRMELFA